MLAALHGPHKIEGAVREGLLERIRNLEVHELRQPLLGGDVHSSLHLHGAQRDGLHLRLVLASQVTGAPADAAPHIHYRLGPPLLAPCNQTSHETQNPHSLLNSQPKPPTQQRIQAGWPIPHHLIAKNSIVVRNAGSGAMG